MNEFNLRKMCEVAPIPTHTRVLPPAVAASKQAPRRTSLPRGAPPSALCYRLLCVQDATSAGSVEGYQQMSLFELITRLIHVVISSCIRTDLEVYTCRGREL